MDALIIAFALISLPLVVSASAAAPVGAWARYDTLSTVERKPPPVSDVTVTVGPPDGGELQWWEMSATKESGEGFAIRLLSERVSITGAKDAPGRVVRYILREGDDQPMEYVDARTGSAFLPKFEFVSGLLPQPMPRARIEHGFAVTGTCMGHVLSLAETGDARPWADWPAPTLLRLNPEEMQYVYGLAKDTEGHYISEGDYHYVPLDQEEVDQLVDLGMNTFWADDDTEDWFYRKPVLYYKQFGEKSKLNYPEILYRSNYRGAVVFIDEPAIHLLGDRADLDRVKRPEDGALLLTKRVEETWNRPSPGKWRQGLLREQLDARGANLGTLALVDDDHPLWETITETSFYQLQGGAQGIVHEGRYQLKEFEQDSERYLGPGVELTPKEMLLLDYAYMRGAARAFGKDWGVAIYGQCDPEIAPLALTLAYDMGARYMWFWTFDHQHHLPHYMKLKLLRHLKEHKAAHPRGPIDKLRDTSRTAIVMPYGYGWILNFCQLWESPNLKVDSPNAAGVPHSEVIAAIVASGIACAKAGEDFDFVVDIGQDLKGYERVVRIRLDGSVTDSRPAPPPTKLSADIVVGRPQLADAASPVLNIQCENGPRTDATSLTSDNAKRFVTSEMPDGREGTCGGPSDLSASLAFAADETRRIFSNGQLRVSLDTMASDEAACTLSVTLTSGKRKVAEGTFPIDLPAGRGRVAAILSATGLNAGVYRCGLVLKSGARKVAEAACPVYVLE
jgi:hypothetical protein